MKGGDEKVEEVRLGLLGFKREIEGLRGKVDGTRGEVEGLVGERKRIREQIQVGRQLLEVETRIGELEERLMLASNGERKGEGDQGEDIISESEGESEEEEENRAIAVPRLRRHMEQYVCIRQLFEKIGDDHPFLVKQEERVLRLKQTLLLDLNSALKQAIAGGEDMKGDSLKLLGIYKQMGQAHEAMNVLKESKGRPG